MSDTPTYANLITRLFSGNPDERAAVIAHLRGDPAAAHAVEAAVRDRLSATLSPDRLAAAEAVIAVYGDRRSAGVVLAGLIRCDSVAVEAVIELLYGYDFRSAELLSLMTRHTPELLSHLPADTLRWAARSAAESWPNGLGLWAEMLAAATPAAACTVLMALAEAAPHLEDDPTAVEGLVRARFADPTTRIAAGAALWRLTWRVNRDWLDAVRAGGPPLVNTPGLRELVLAVLIEHLGRRRDLTPLARVLLGVVAQALPDEGRRLTARLAGLGSAGWAVLLPVLGEAGGPTPRALQVAVYEEAAARPGVLSLIHHHAHKVIVDAADGRDRDLDALVPPTATVLALLGPSAGTAVPDLLNLAARRPTLAAVAGGTIPKLAAGFPNAPAAVVRTLHKIRTTDPFGTEQAQAFQALAGALAELAPDAVPALTENTAIDPRVADLLAQQPGWKDAAPEVRRRHARTLADKLGSPRPEVRLRAAELLRHYRAELPGVWPALVALLAGADEKAAAGVLPLFRHLKPVADEVMAELVALFREPNPDYAARAVVALWRLGRIPTVADDLRAAVEGGPESGWGWSVLRGVVDRVAQAHGLLRDLGAVFAASPAAVAGRVDALVNPPESAVEASLTALIPRSDDPSAPAAVGWDAAHALIGTDGAGPFLFVALMCEYGAAGYNRHKIWLIKGQRTVARTGLAESKGIVEEIADDILARPGALAHNRHRAVRRFFTDRTELPHEIVAMLDHPVSWFRWAGLELADAWGLTPEQTRDLTDDRLCDRSGQVRERAARMARG